MLVEIFLERVRRRRRDIAGLRRTESKIVDAALLVLVLIERASIAAAGTVRPPAMLSAICRRSMRAALLVDEAAFGDSRHRG